MSLEVVLGECVELMRGLEPCSVDAVVTDPPYGIGFMGHEWDQPSHPALRGNGEWRGGGPSFGGSAAMVAGRYDLSMTANRRFQAWCEAWALEAFRVLRPGGWLLAFGGTRTSHRLTCGLEDAGFEIRDSLLWLFGSGFPKSLDVSKAIDKAAGAEREVVGKLGGSGYTKANVEQGAQGRDTWEWDKLSEEPATEDAARWRGWGTALKPAHEPVAVARKPLEGTVAGNVLAHGTGALNVDGCRVPVVGETVAAGHADSIRRGTFNEHEGWDRPWKADAEDHAGRREAALERANELGRWPANVLLSHAEGCVPAGVREVASDGHFPAARPGGVQVETVGHAGQEGLEERHTRGEAVEVWECAEGCPVAELDRQSGRSRSAGGQIGKTSEQGGTVYEGGWASAVAGDPGFGDAGGASRFFYVAKASRAERDAGLDALPNRPSLKFDPTSAMARDGRRGSGVARNAHPTVKPIDVMRWLVRLVTPPGGLVLDPFAGSGTTGIACALEGFRFLGLEQDEGHVAVARARIAFWAEHGEHALVALRAAEAAERLADRRREQVAEAGQLDLLGGAA